MHPKDVDGMANSADPNQTEQSDLFAQICLYKYEPPRDKTNKITFAPSEDSDQSGHLWSESSLSPWRNIGFSATHWAHCEDWGRCPGWSESSLGAQTILLVLSWGCLYSGTCIIIQEPYQCFDFSPAVLSQELYFCKHLIDVVDLNLHHLPETL